MVANICIIIFLEKARMFKNMIEGVLTTQRVIDFEEWDTKNNNREGDGLQAETSYTNEQIET